MKELGVVNEKLGRLNRAIKEVNACVEVRMFRANEKDDVKVKVSAQSQEFVALVQYLRNSDKGQCSSDNQSSSSSK